MWLVELHVPVPGKKVWGRHSMSSLHDMHASGAQGRASPNHSAHMLQCLGKEHPTGNFTPPVTLDTCCLIWLDSLLIAVIFSFTFLNDTRHGLSRCFCGGYICERRSRWSRQIFLCTRSP